MKNILITGGLGFIGFNAIQQWSTLHPEYKYFVIDIETYAAQFCINEKHEWLTTNNISFFKCNICDEFAVDAIVKQYNIDTIVNFAAESHVDNSISDPDIFFQTNIIGVVKLLNIAKKYDLRFHQVSTDEVYGPSTPKDAITEKSRLNPSSPYSSSKASADLIALSYYKTFGTKVTISRCTNNFGKYQHCEKLIGTIVCSAKKNKNIPVYGDGLQKRHWIYVDDHNKAILEILENGIAGNVYNIGPAKENYITNLDLIKFILKHLRKSEDLIEFVTDRAAHDTSYYLTPTCSFCSADSKWTDCMPNVISWYANTLKL